MADQSILIFGAGKIGRSFIGQLFSKAGYEVVFVDMDLLLINELNERGTYPVIIKGPDSEERLIIENVRAIHALELSAVVEAISVADIMAISVGKSALSAIAPNVAAGLVKRENLSPGEPLDIILAENMRAADLFFRKELRKNLPPSFPLDKQVGLVETSIGKMVPIMTNGDKKEDPLQVFAEPYNTLILDKKGFRGEIPGIKEFALKENMKAWVDRKAFIHNLGHATAAYFGHLKYPHTRFMHEVLADPEVYAYTKKVMLESAEVLMATYPGEFTRESISNHTDDLLQRFQNRNLGDTVFRVGSDLYRKLGADDRFMGIIRLSEKAGLTNGMILEAFSIGFLFKATDENGHMFGRDIEFHEACSNNLDQLLKYTCGLDIGSDANLIALLKQNLNKQRLKRFHP